MQELLPILIGVALGGVCCRIGSARVRGAAAVLLSLVGGALSTTINGEWSAGLLPFLADVGFVAGGSLAVVIGWTLLVYVRRSPAIK